jgi:hypothetical protein
MFEPRRVAAPASSFSYRSIDERWSITLAAEILRGDKKFSLASGESYFAPRNVPHRLRNRSQTPARSLLLTTPGGFDAFISEPGIRLMEGITPPVELPTPDQMAKMLKLAEVFGIKIIAPPEPPQASNQPR